MKNKTTRSSYFGRKRYLLGASVAALALGSCLTAGAAFADEATDAQDALTETPTYFQSGLFSDQEANTSKSKLSLKSTGFPSTLDLRHYNGTVTYDEAAGKNVIEGGTNYVSPVKLQSPFGSCWAFSIIASAETSLLTSLDKTDDGEMNGSINYEKAASGQAGNVAYSVCDLSERALAYSVFTYPKTDDIYSSQAGEGNYLSSGVMNDGAQIIDVGGMPFTGVSTFSCGIGPLPESYAPYISDEGWIQVSTPELTGSSSNMTLKKKYFTSLAEAIEFWNETWTDEVIAKFNEENDADITKRSVRPTRSSKGTWAVDGDKTYGTVAELKESKILETVKGDGLTNDEIASMKEELMEGRAISIAFCSDQSRPGQAISTASSYINTDTWAHYTYEGKRVNHGVTIVGYDDDYAASNFTHNQYKEDKDGNLVVDEEKTAKTTPPGNGAWIVKNSWGSESSDNYLDQNSWGDDGYFYLSYYDKSISSMESYEFDTSEEAQAESSFISSQYDLSKGSQTTSHSSSSVTKTCNVFDGYGEDNLTVSIRDLGCITGATCDTVTLDVYVMDADADVTETIAKSDPTTSETEYFSKSGFHRLHLDSPVLLSGSEKIAVVQTTKRVNGSYECTCIRGLSEELTTKYNDAHTSTIDPDMSSSPVPSYTHSVVNKGESLIYEDGEWKDWSEQRVQFGADETKSLCAEIQAEGQQYEMLALMSSDPTTKAIFQEFADNLKNFTVSEAYAYDNFSIKIYGDEVTDPVDISEASVKLSQSSFTYDGTAKTPEVTSVTLSDGTVLSKDNYSVSYSDNVNAGAALVTVTGEGDFQGTATKVFAIQRAELPSAAVTISPTAFVYNGSAMTPQVTVGNLTYGTDFFTSFSNNISAGTATVTVKGIENYKGTITKTFEIAKAAQPIMSTSEVIMLAANKKGVLANKAMFIADLDDVQGNAAVAYSLKSVTSKAKNYISVSSTGKVTIKKGLAKGAYTLKVKCDVAATANYQSATVYLTYKIVVK